MAATGRRPDSVTVNLNQSQGSGGRPLGEGRIAGAYFGILTRMDTPAEVISQVFGEVHMMPHLKGAETRAAGKERQNFPAQK
jgi:hypothetical protein